jgi:hypothetical protein
MLTVSPGPSGDASQAIQSSATLAASVGWPAIFWTKDFRAEISMVEISLMAWVEASSQQLRTRSQKTGRV